MVNLTSSGLHRKTISVSALLCLFIIVFTSCSTPKSDVAQYASDRGKRLVADKAMVSSAHPLASEAGLKMLENGGNAVDAAVATAFALNVVEPNMSGVGGGGSMLIWEQENKTADYLDFYTAKRAETYKDLDYDQFGDDEFTLLSTGIPGTVKGLLQALERNGTMTREEVMAPAIRYATEGFPVYLTLAQFITDNEEKLGRYEGAKRTFWPDEEPLKVGETLKQPELAETLQKISDKGPSAFYEGEIAEDMVKVLNEAGNPVTLDDFSEFEPQWDKTPLCGTYKDYKVLSAPLPQTGVYIVQALNILENYDLKAMGLPTVSAEAFDILSSTMRLSIADQIEYISDPNWENIPVDALISKEYADERRSLVGTGNAPKEMKSGNPIALEAALDTPSECGDETVFATSKRMNTGLDQSLTEATISAGTPNDYFDEAEGAGETTHISVVDPEGNAVSLSTTLSHVFGSGAWVNGFILNNSGFNFSYLDDDEWTGSHPYRIRSSTISPTIILEDNEVRLVIGAPGGGRIPTAVLQNILYILEYDLDPIDAVKMPRIFPGRSSTSVQIEKGFDSNILKDVRNMNYDLKTLSQGYARLYLVSKENGKLIGVADPRHDGEVRGF